MAGPPWTAAPRRRPPQYERRRPIVSPATAQARPPRVSEDGRVFGIEKDQQLTRNETVVGAKRNRGLGDGTAQCLRRQGQIFRGSVAPGATVDVQHLAGDKGRRLAGQERYGIGYLR